MARPIVVSRNFSIIILTLKRGVISTEFVADFGEIAKMSEKERAKEDLTKHLMCQLFTVAFLDIIWLSN